MWEPDEDEHHPGLCACFDKDDPTDSMAKIHAAAMSERVTAKEKEKEKAASVEPPRQQVESDGVDEQLQKLIDGISVLKHGRRGKPKKRLVQLNPSLTVVSQGSTPLSNTTYSH